MLICATVQANEEDNTLARGIKHDYWRLHERIDELGRLGAGQHRLVTGEVGTCSLEAGRDRVSITDKFGRTTQLVRSGESLERYDGRIRVRFERSSGQLRQIVTNGANRSLVQVNPDGSTDMTSFPCGLSPVHHHAPARTR